DVGFGGDQGLFGGVHRLEQLSHSCRTGVRSHSGNIRRPSDRNKRVVSSFADGFATAPYPRLRSARRRYLPPTCGWGTIPGPPRSARALPRQSRGRNPGLAGGTFPQPAVGGLSRSRTTVKGMPYRLIYIGLGLLGAAALILGIVFAKDGDPTDLPGALVSVSPEPNELVPPQAVLEVVLPV